MIEIHWTTGSIDEARRLARHLVEKQWVASAKIIPWIESIYLWDGQVHTVQESKVIFKTIEKFFDQIQQAINEQCKYQIPEITCLQVENVNPEYQEWLRIALKL
jgi:periplasmic divalent cation tolerance protein